MTQNERWIVRYNEVMDFIEKNRRDPSKYRIEDYLMLNFIKHTRKLLNAGKIEENMIGKFNGLMDGYHERDNIQP